MEAPYLVPYFPVMPTFFVRFPIVELKMKMSARKTNEHGVRVTREKTGQ